ncbi:LOW QUALITY PROTEIN: uncharacterized protein LOC21390620 [Morus notabilis]|uniref:LOW QUALITY PROTEIN: uncharacterized protein LOC21390620 n=1 Tax=Morus notabilis TaxID=981085 RepID=UPI000CED169D|nr:LOW QUALITY PROTEIN: uncharacterized protein LOC21390620 [Morus notabilis]
MVVEGMKCGGVNGGQVVVDDDMGDGMQCSDHPYRNNPGGICAFCLQEKLGKLVSSSFPLPIRASSSAASSTSSPNSFRSDCLNSKNDAVLNDCRFYNADEYYATTNARAARPRNGSITNNGNGSNNNNISFLLNVVLAKKKKKVGVVAASSGSSSSMADHVVLKRSKSTTTPRRGRGGRFLEASDDLSPRKRGGFWSFLYLSSSFASTKKGFANGESSKTASFSSVTSAGLAVKPKERRPDRERERERETASSVVVLEENDSPNSQATASASSFERKVSRSRSVGCGSRSFSGDFFERISTGFGDCTLRRVESQREGNGAGKPKSSATSSHHGGGEHHCMKERVKCGGIFGGFILTSSSSSSSSSSYWVSSADDVNGPKHVAGGPGPLAHGRIRSWGWAFASPMRAFGKPSGSNGKRDIIRQASDKNSSASATTTTTPNLAAIPSLLAVRG